jgi:hypothetical protein
MAKMTNLQMVQNILSSMDSDNVNSISDTEEAAQVELVLQECYEEITTRRKWTHQNRTRQLEDVSDVTKPNKLRIPTEVTRVNEFRWKHYADDVIPPTVDQDNSWKLLRWKSPSDFIAHVQGRNVAQLTEQGRVLVVYNDDGVEMPMITDVQPEFWTSFDDEYIYMDNFITSNANTATSGRTSINVTQQKIWVSGDDEIAELPTEMFPLLLAEAKSTCWLNFKGEPNQKAEQSARRLYIKMREEEPTVEYPRRWVDYGKPPNGSLGSRSNYGWRYNWRA